MIRLFTAVSVPPEIREKIAALITELKPFWDLPEDIRFVPPRNLHLTLTFLGSQPDSVVPKIKEFLDFDFDGEVEFKELTYGPSGRRPRMIWLTATSETSRRLGEAKKYLEDSFESQGIGWRRESRPYSAHLTLARFPQTLLGNLPPIGRKIDWRYRADEVCLMSSLLRRTGAEYEVL